jgi:hypothetical protein
MFLIEMLEKYRLVLTRGDGYVRVREDRFTVTPAQEVRFELLDQFFPQTT